MLVSGLELVNLCEIRKWNTQFHRKISNGKTGLPFQKFHFRKFSSGTNRKIMFHIQPNRNFRNLLVNGKHPCGAATSDCVFQVLPYHTVPFSIVSKYILISLREEADLNTD